MSKKSKTIKFKNVDYNPSRRKFFKKIGIGIVAASTYSVISLSHFSCSDSTSPGLDFSNGGTYNYS